MLFALGKSHYRQTCQAHQRYDPAAEIMSRPSPISLRAAKTDPGKRAEPGAPRRRQDSARGWPFRQGGIPVRWQGAAAYRAGESPSRTMFSWPHSGQRRKTILSVKSPGVRARPRRSSAMATVAVNPGLDRNQRTDCLSHAPPIPSCPARRAPQRLPVPDARSHSQHFTAPRRQPQATVDADHEGDGLPQRIWRPVSKPPGQNLHRRCGDHVRLRPGPASKDGQADTAVSVRGSHVPGDPPSLAFRPRAQLAWEQVDPG